MTIHRRSIARFALIAAWVAVSIGADQFCRAAAQSASASASSAPADAPTSSTSASAQSASPAPLPPDIKWETNMDEPLIGDPKAIRGGTYYDFIPSYPLTLRLMGPNSNDAFAGYNRAYTMYFTLVWRHPTTDKFIPCLATHWAVMPDQKTLYFRLDPDARWSDGQPITADDYVFTLEMLRSPHIVDPYYNTLADEYFDKVEAIDPHTLRIVGKKTSWRPLDDYAFYPMPRHAIHLDADWVKRTNNEPQVAAGPYTITETVAGERVVFSRVPNWWGNKKRYFTGLYNVDRIYIRVIPDLDRAFDLFKRGELSTYLVTSARRWATETDFEAIQKGWAHRKRVFVEMPKGVYGFAMNLEFPLFQNKDFRKALQYLFDFDTLNSKMMFNAYYRMTSSFEGTEYANPNLKPYGFDPKKAREHLQKAGFTKRGPDGILQNASGQRASFTLTYGSESLERHLTVIKQTYQKAGVEMNLQRLEGATAFNRLLERKYEMALINYTSGFYPEPHQYYASIFKKNTNNNNIWSFGREDTDKLIDIYRFDLDKSKRLDAMFKLDEILHDEAFWIPFWDAPYLRFLYWDYVRYPENFLPRRTEELSDWQVYWIDPVREARLREAMTQGRAFEPDSVVDIDAYGVKARMEKAAAQPETKEK